MGTVIVEITDAQNQVREVNFYTKRGAEARTGPYPPDIVRRPLPGVYEKDVVLDSEFVMKVFVEILLDDGTLLTNFPAPEFTTRSPSAGGGATTLLVQDEDTLAAMATKLVFQGKVVDVQQVGSDRVATMNLDGRYVTHDGANSVLAGYATRAEGDTLYALAAHQHDGRYAPLAHDHSFASLTARPTTMAGYGITDGVTQASLANYLPTSGGTISGALALTGAAAGVTLNPQAGGGGSWAWNLHTRADVLRFHSQAFNTDKATLGQFGDLWLARDLAAGGAISAGAHVAAAGIQANSAGSPSAGGVSLYGTGSGAPDSTYGVFFRGTTHGSTWGTHGYTTGDWATYFSMDGSHGRGWIFRNHTAGNVASITNAGHAWFNGQLNARQGVVARDVEMFVGPTYTSTIRTVNNGPIHLQAGSTGVVAIGDGAPVAGYKLSVDGSAKANGIYLSVAAGAFMISNHGSFWQAQNSGGGYDHFLWPRASDNNTYLNFGAGGNLYIRNNASTTKVMIHDIGVSCFGTIQMYAGAAGGNINMHAGHNSHSHLGGGQIYFGDSTASYRIGKSSTGVSLGGGYAQLDIAYHTGIRIGAQPGYGGVRFFDSETFGNVLFSVAGIGGTDTNTRVHGNNYLVIGPNATHGRLFVMGGNTWHGGSEAHLFASDGSFHMDARVGHKTYLSYFSGSPVVIGQSQQPASGFSLTVGGGMRIADAGGTHALHVASGSVRFDTEAITDMNGHHLGSVVPTQSAPSNSTPGRVGTLWALY
jgi:hypothetical protein